MNMLQRVEPYVAYGYPNLKTVRELIYKRGFGKVNKARVPLTDNSVIEGVLGAHNIICVEDLVHEIFTSGPAFKQASAAGVPLAGVPLAGVLLGCRGIVCWVCCAMLCDAVVLCTRCTAAGLCWSGLCCADTDCLVQRSLPTPLLAQSLQPPHPHPTAPSSPAPPHPFPCRPTTSSGPSSCPPPRAALTRSACTTLRAARSVPLAARQRQLSVRLRASGPAGQCQCFWR